MGTRIGLGILVLVEFPFLSPTAALIPLRLIVGVCLTIIFGLSGVVTTSCFGVLFAVRNLVHTETSGAVNTGTIKYLFG